VVSGVLSRKNWGWLRKMEEKIPGMIYYRTISHLIELFILPEIKKRIKNNTIKKDDLPFEITQFRTIQVKQPDGGFKTIVELNKEVNLYAKIKMKRAVSAGETITLNDVYPEECYLESPKFNGKPAGYFYVKLMAFQFLTLAFNCEPNLPGVTENEIEDFKMKFPIREIIGVRDFQDIVKPYEKLQILSQHNWPPAPGYYPNVFLELHNDSAKINKEEFIQVVSNSYNKNYWEERIAFWKTMNFFPDRIQYLEKSITAHFEKDFIASTYVLVPQFEGIVKDYLLSCGEIPSGGFMGYIKILKNLITSRKILLFSKSALGPIFDYLENGSFWKHTSSISDPRNIINRHGILHGEFTEFENEGISLKYLILLDSLSFLLLHDKILNRTI